MARIIVSPAFVTGLLRNHAFVDQSLPAGVSDAGNLFIGLSLFEIRLILDERSLRLRQASPGLFERSFGLGHIGSSLFELLVHLGSFDDSEQLARLDFGSDVYV